MKWNGSTGKLRPELGPEVVAAALCDMCMTGETKEEAITKMLEAMFEGLAMWERIIEHESP